MTYIFGMSQFDWDELVLEYLEAACYSHIHHLWDIKVATDVIMRTANDLGYGEGYGVENLISDLDNMLEVYIVFEQSNLHLLNRAILAYFYDCICYDKTNPHCVDNGHCRW